MGDVAVVAISLLITLVIFLAVRPLWRRLIGTDHDHPVDSGDDREKTAIAEDRYAGVASPWHASMTRRFRPEACRGRTPGIRHRQGPRAPETPDRPWVTEFNANPPL